MSKDLISRKTRNEFREFLVSFTLRVIETEFDSAGVGCDLDYQPLLSGQRRTLVEQYYHTVNWAEWQDVQKVLKAYEFFLLEAFKVAENSTDEQSKQNYLKTVNNLIGWLKRDGYQWIDGRLISGPGLSAMADIKQVATEFDAKHLAEQIRRIEQSVESDPPLAIGTAKELIETCCKTILSERGKTVTNKPDVPQLVRETLRELKLLPDDVPERAKGSDVIKRLLSNLGTIAQGLAEIRSLYGTGHGKHGKEQSVKPRHAKLAVGAASTLATFLFETHRDKHE